MSKKEYLLLSVSLVFSLGAGFIGSLFTITEPGSWYALINKPAFNPPNWLFGSVWTVLFILMGASLFLVWRQGWKNEAVRAGVKLFIIQLGFNITWSYFFFGLHNPRLAFMEIIALWLAIIATIIAFNRVNRLAAKLLWPYLAWVSFAAFLNYTIWQLNL